MYDSSSSDKKSPLSVKKAIGSCFYAEEGAPDLSQLDNSELSLDLQGLIDDNLFNDILVEKASNVSSKEGGLSLSAIASFNNRANVTLNALNYIPGAVHANSGSYLPNLQVKKEPPDEINDQVDLSPASNQTLSPTASTPSPVATRPSVTFPRATTVATPYTPVVPTNSITPAHNGFSNYTPANLPGCETAMFKNTLKKGLSSKKNINKMSEEYRRRRERNNIAVRKSREKAKVRTKETEDRVRILARDNDKLRRQIDVLSRELNWLKNVYPKLGVIPEHVQREITKQLEAFQHHAGL